MSASSSEVQGPKLPALIELIEPDEEENSPPLPENGLLFPVDLTDRRSIEGFKSVVDSMVQELGGLPPIIETIMVENPADYTIRPKLISKFSTDKMTDEQFVALEEIGRRSYGSDVKTRKNKFGKTSTSHLYPKLEATGREKPTIETIIGWYLGLQNGTPTRMYDGLFVYRNIGRRDIANGVKVREDADWFTQPALYDNSGNQYSGGSYTVEIRESGTFGSAIGKIVNGKYQSDLAQEIIYTSLVLAGKNLPPEKPGLIYDIYHKMNQVGLGPSTDLPGLEEQIEIVERSMILPLSSPELTKSLRGNAKSVGLIGQVGTGKTQIIKDLMRRDLGVMLVPINSKDFEKDLLKTENTRTLLPRIKDVSEKLGKNVVLVIEDLENLANRENEGSNALLNELAGLYSNGYRILWTTNHPEVFNPQLLEPERLGGKLVFCGLPGPEARKLILDQHLVKLAGRRKIPVFDPELISSNSKSPDEARDLILQLAADATDGYTPRFLKDVVVEAISQFMYRIKRKTGRMDGLGEEALSGESFIVDDWMRALIEVAETYDVQARKSEDERLFKLTKLGTVGKKGNFSFEGTRRDETTSTIKQLIEGRALILQNKIEN